MLTRAETATAEALQDAEIEVAEGEAALTALQGRADRLPDGTRVYRDADGSAFAEGGRKLTAEEFESVVWHEGAPTWEAYKAKKEAHEKVLQDREAILRYQRDVLDPARHRLSDEDNPPSLEELKAIEMKSSKTCQIRSAAATRPLPRRILQIQQARPRRKGNLSMARHWAFPGRPSNSIEL